MGRTLTYFSKIRAPFIIGACASLAAFLPLYGSTFGIPGSFFAALLTPVLLGLLALSGYERPTFYAYASLALTGLLLFLIVTQASADQFSFAFDVSQWRYRADRYVEAKLLMILLISGPAIVGAAALLLCEDKAVALNGALLAIAMLAGIAAIRVFALQGPELLRTDYLTARNSIAGATGYSIVGYGTLFVIGALCALRYKYGWIAAGTLLFATVLLSRRADTLLLVIFLLIFLSLAILFRWRATKYGGALGLAAILAVTLHNEHNYQYFNNILTGIQYRIEMVDESIVTRSIPHDELEREITNADPIQEKEQNSNTNNIELNGLGSYQDATGSRFEFPHNIYLEAWVELGLLAMLVIILLTATPIAIAIRWTSRGRVDERFITCVGFLCLLIGLSLKSGDLTSIGRLIFASSLVFAAAQAMQNVTRLPTKY